MPVVSAPSQLRAESAPSQLRAETVPLTPIVRDEIAFFALHTRHAEMCRLVRALTAADPWAHEGDIDLLILEADTLMRQMQKMAEAYIAAAASRSPALGGYCD